MTPAPYASMPELSRGRLYPEREATARTAFQRDRDRIIHSTAFRRLAHKTQVFVYHEGDHYRTRLTHSLEVAQIARAMARTLALDEDLAEALALAHDFGHTPFGHAGEEALDKCMADYGGFDHNAHTLRIVTGLEHRYAEFDGLNLTWETLEGLVKHNGPLAGPLPRAVEDYLAVHDLEVGTWPSAEAQLAAIADDIAYNSHDVDDGLRAGLFGLDALADIPVLGEIICDVRAQYPDLEAGRLYHEVVRRLIGRMIDDVLAETRRRLDDLAQQTVADIRAAKGGVVGFSKPLLACEKGLKAFLRRHMYQHYKVNRMMSKAARVVDDLFALYMSQPGILPDQWKSDAESMADAQLGVLVGDFIAGMTDRFPIDEHRRLFDLSLR